uniref:Uncharacterized protein n=1 Tax=Oryza meridionalis TaxID=40149 RepID=A0A0E0F7U2_9ORYZ
MGAARIRCMRARSGGGEYRGSSTQGQELGRYLGRKWPAVEVAVLPQPSSTLAWHRHPKSAKGFLKLSPTPKVCFVSLNRASYC